MKKKNLVEFIVNPIDRRYGKRKKKFFRCKVVSSHFEWKMVSWKLEIDRFLESEQERIGIICLYSYELYMCNNQIVIEIEYLEVPKDRVYPSFFPGRGRPRVVLSAFLMGGEKSVTHQFKYDMRPLYTQSPLQQCDLRFVSEKACSDKDFFLSILTSWYAEQTIKISNDCYLFCCFYFRLVYF